MAPTAPQLIAALKRVKNISLSPFEKKDQTNLDILQKAWPIGQLQESLEQA